MVVGEVYLLTLHEPYREPRHPAPVNATIVHAATLLHPSVPQPDGGQMYRCLTEFPGRDAGCVVPLSTLTFELDGGRLWHRIGDWEAVVNAVVALSRGGRCDAMPLALPQVPAVLLANGPHTVCEFHHPDGTRSRAGDAERRQHLATLERHVRTAAAQRPLWPGDNLLSPPLQPSPLPYLPATPLPDAGKDPSPTESGPPASRPQRRRRRFGGF